MNTRTRTGLISVSVLVGALVLPWSGWACVFDGPAKIEDQAWAAGSILLGTVVETKSYFGVDGEIYTDVTLWVEADLKNPSFPAKVILTVLGGQVGNRYSWVEDTPGFSLNERVLVFLKERATPTPSMLTASALDKYWVKEDVVRGRNLDWLYGDGTAIPLQEFIAQIQAALKP